MMSASNLSRVSVLVCAGLMILALAGCPRPDLDGRLVVQRIIETDPPDDVQSGFVTVFDFELTDGTGHTWELDSDGAVDDGGNDTVGTEDAFDDFVVLSIDSVPFPVQLTADLEDDREVVYGPATLSGLNVTRKVFVSETSGFARWLDILRNPNLKGGNITVNVRIDGDVGSDEDNNFVANSTNGNTTLEVTDNWWTNCQDHPDDPCVGSFTCGAIITKIGDDFTYDYGNVTVPPGGRVILVTYMLMRSSGVQNTALNQLDNALEELEGFPLVSPEFLEGMTQAELNDVYVCGGNVEVAGLPNAVADFAMVTANNTDSGDSATAVATRNGAFALNLIGDAGDSVEVDSSDGQMATMIVP